MGSIPTGGSSEGDKMASETSKYSSRKFIIALYSITVIFFISILSQNASIALAVAGISGAYIGGQSIVDSVARWKNGGINGKP